MNIRMLLAGVAVTVALSPMIVPSVAAQPAVTIVPLQGPANQANPAERLSAPLPVRFTSKIGFFDSDPALGASYPRVIQLGHFAGGKGELLATFARRGPLPIYRSTDNGETWSFVSEVPNMRGQPALYELPRQVGTFPAGTIMAAGTVEEAPGATRHAIKLSYSTDGGRTWTPLSTISEGGVGSYDPVNRAGLSDQSPVWEPFLFVDTRGRLVAYISNEGFKKDGYSQLLEHKVSPDGGRTWGPAVNDVAIGDGLTRPGMAVVTRGGDGTYFMSYEVVGKAGVALEPRSNLAHFRTSRDGLNWGDPADPGVFIQDRWRQYANGTPYIAWSPWGGPNGTLMVTGRSIMRYEVGRIGNGMMINRNNGRGAWTLIETPIVYNPANDGYSHTMIPLGNGREVLQLVSVNNRIAYAKFELPETLPVTPFAGGWVPPLR
ncbi:sialidase family protein [Glacieibacterium sp.]|uniref:sialidase family protein n=1 Tax=Glacieibacterium sp. TaxID=2860237 RepID=UPI003B00DD5E